MSENSAPGPSEQSSGRGNGYASSDDANDEHKAEIPLALYEEITSWRRVIHGANPEDARDLLKRAALDLFRGLLIVRTETPASHAITHNVVIDALQEFADFHHIAGDDAQLIFARAAESIDSGAAHEYRPQPEEPMPKDWKDPDWSILEDRRGELPDFPEDTLPKNCRNWAERAAHGAGATLAHVVVPMMGIIASLIGTARRVMASRSWTEPMTLWTAIVGFSGTSKTPGINATRRALAQVQRDLKPKIAEQQRAHESRVESAKAARAVWKKEIEVLAKKEVVSLNEYRSTIASEPVMPPEAVDPGPFVAPRLYVSNVTIERLAVLLQARPQGMLMLADELAALFLNMSRYSTGQDNEFWLEAWNGDSYTVERMGRPPIAVDYLLVGIVGGMQPDKLARSFKGDLDGMYARVLFAWPTEPGYRPLTDEVAEIEPEIVSALMRIVGLEGGQGKDGEFAPRSIPLSPLATDTFQQFLQFSHAEKHSLEGREREWWSKTPAHVLRLGGTLCYLDWAMSGDEEPKFIEDRFIKSAVRLVRDYFWPHSRAALRQIGLTERHANERRVLRWIAARRRTEVSLMDVRRDALGQSLDAEQTLCLLGALVKAGWLRQTTTQTRGRSRRRWQVNPQLFSTCNAGNAGSAGSAGSTDSQPLA